MFDLHVHAAPDITPRRAEDRDIVAEYAAAGFSGCVLKGHYESTVGRAVAAGRDQDISVFGGIALNQHAGGVNPAAVSACLEAGGRVVWMPTADAHTQASAGLPRLCVDHPRLSDHSYAIPPVDWSVADEVRSICSMIADADAVLATGHVSADEAHWLVQTAREFGIRRCLLTHPGYTVPAMSAERTAELVRLGAVAEITTFQLLHQPGCSADWLAAFADSVGLDNVVLSSDAGQPNSPSPPEALEMLVDALAAEGLDRAALTACAAEQPESLVVP